MPVRPRSTACGKDIFNDRVWPDFIEHVRKRSAVCQGGGAQTGSPRRRGGLRLTPIAVDHVVPTLGFLIESARGDRRHTLRHWADRVVFGAPPERRLTSSGVFLEASFPNAMSGLAVISKHLTPAMFAAEARKLPNQVPIVAVHIKPRTYDQVVAELNALELPDLRHRQTRRDLRLLSDRTLEPAGPAILSPFRPGKDRTA